MDGGGVARQRWRGDEDEGGDSSPSNGGVDMGVPADFSAPSSGRSPRESVVRPPDPYGDTEQLPLLHSEMEAEPPREVHIDAETPGPSPGSTSSTEGGAQAPTGVPTDVTPAQIGQERWNQIVAQHRGDPAACYQALRRAAKEDAAMSDEGEMQSAGSEPRQDQVAQAEEQAGIRDTVAASPPPPPAQAHPAPDPRPASDEGSPGSNQPNPAAPLLPSEFGLDWLTREPSPPRHRLLFELPQVGTWGVWVHDYTTGPGCLVIRFDTRYRGEHWLPPNLGQTVLPVRNPHTGEKWNAYSLGQYVQIGDLVDEVIFLINDDEQGGGDG